MPIVPAGSVNLSGIGVPNVYVQILPPNPLLNGVPTNIVGVVGTASWGAVNSPTIVGSIQDQIYNFGNPVNRTYDLGTPVYTGMQQGANNFVCVRVTDGTDMAATVNVVDGSAVAGAILTSVYTGSWPNSNNGNCQYTLSQGSLSTTYKLSIYFANGIPEVFDNIGGSGAAFWANLSDAVNFGQNQLRGPSQLCTAQSQNAIGSVTVSAAGSYATLPTLGTTGSGTGATLVPVMKAVSATVVAGGSGYSVSDSLTIVGGTETTAAILTVLTVDGSGAILTVSVSATSGSYTALPTDPVSVTGGGGTLATFNVLWGLKSVTVSSGGNGYTLSSGLLVTGGGGTGGALGALVLSSSASAPALATHAFTGGTDGATNITTAVMLGSDTATPRTGMYALRNSKASVAMLSDVADNTSYQAQSTFGNSEGIYMVAVEPAGLQDNIAGMISTLQAGTVQNYNFKVMGGDWIYLNDPFNNVTRLVSPQGYTCGVLSVTPPSGSSLNKAMTAIVNTQKTYEQRIYSDADLLALITAGVDIITKPIPLSPTVYGVRLGINTSANVVTKFDNYPRMVNFLAQTMVTGMGQFIGQPQTPDLQRQARDTLNTFLSNLQQIGWIGTLDGSPAFSVILDSSNNPTQQVALGYMQADVQVVLFSIVQQLVINLQAGGNVQIQVAPPQVLTSQNNF